ncbi:hypothetical protein [Pseudomonas sp. Tri1]|uniref:hypothetical protein n=1 Tax=Pseudomonas sp. Tri1 TaxID=2823875 RepID=UPI001B34484C|nr:hypothetical protein [Pseudomonas sp. Tri1]
MKYIKAFVFGLLLSNYLVYSSSAFSATGTIILRDKENAICSFDLPEPGQTKTYSFTIEPYPCERWDNRARTIQLAEVPSATIILLSDFGGCLTSGYTWLKLKTTKKQTSTSIQPIEYLTTYRKNQIIEPGLQMVDLEVTEEFRDKLSCIQITTSAAPPSSP